MKKKIFLILILAIFVFAKSNASTVAFINGHITNTLSGMPAIAYPIIITDSINFTQTIYTDTAGYYTDSIGNNSSNPVKYYILIYDCNNALHYDTVTTSAYVVKTANFSVCYNFYDAGVTDILTPASSVMIGDSIHPSIKFKNFGTLEITNIKLGIKINGQQIALINWWGNLSHDSSCIYTFNQYFVSPASSFNIVAFTQLMGDVNSYNDKDSIMINVSPALNDVGIIEIIPGNYICNGSITYPKAVIKNFGLNPKTSIPLSYQVATMLPSTGTWTSTIPLNYGDTVHYTFATYFATPIASTFNLSAYTTLIGDANLSNNKLLKSINVIAVPPYSFNIIGDDTVLTDQSNVVYHTSYMFSNDQYIWTVPYGSIINSTYNNYIEINYLNNAQNGNISCKIINNCGSSQTMFLPVSVFLVPPPPIIYQSGYNLFSGYSSGNQWYFETTAISGANLPFYTATQSGHYYCIVNINGITSPQSNSIYVAFTGIDDAYIKSHFNVFPNPFTDKTNFKYSLNKSVLVNLKISDMEGRLIRTLVNEEQSTGEFSYQLNANNLSKGIYFYQFKAGNTSLNGKLIIK